MGTRSTIALEYADGTVEQIYCHWDGYLEHNGKILAKHYSDPFKLRDLIDLGAISSLKPEVGEKQDFDKRETQNENWTLAYARDRGEDLRVNKFKDFADYVANHQYEEYEYILRAVNGKATWFVDCGACGYVTLETAFLNAKETA
jgi:hypothetical protein